MDNYIHFLLIILVFELKYDYMYIFTYRKILKIPNSLDYLGLLIRIFTFVRSVFLRM